MHLKYTASATWGEEERLVLLLADARSGWSVIRWRKGVTCAVTGWCAQWAGFHQPVSEAVIFPQFHLLSASQAVSSAPGELWCGGATDSQQHRDTQMRGRERHTTVPWEETLTAVFLPRTEQLRFWTDFMVSAFAWCQHYYNIAATDIFWRGINALCSIKMGFPAQDWRIYVIITWGYRYQTTLISTAE